MLGSCGKLRKLEADKVKVKERRRKREGNGCESLQECCPCQSNSTSTLCSKVSGFQEGFGGSCPRPPSVLSALHCILSASYVCLWKETISDKCMDSYSLQKNSIPSSQHWLMHRGCSTSVCQVTRILKMEKVLIKDISCKNPRAAQGS